MMTSRWAAPDLLFRGVSTSAALAVLFLVASIFLTLAHGAAPAVHAFGVSFLTTDRWDPVSEEFGALSSIYGTLVSTALAMLLAVPLSFTTALFLVELAPPSVGRLVGGALELLAAVPSIIYGIWGLFVFAPLMADHVQPWLGEHLGFLPLFEGPPMGIGMLTAGVILGFMVLPYICSVTRDVLKMIPPVTREAAYGMGATTWEAARRVSVPYCLHGIVGAVFLGLGRAIGETMAVTFVIGNDHSIGSSLFDAGTTISATLANEFSEAVSPIYIAALIELGLVLFVISLLFQSIAHLWTAHIGRKMRNAA